MESCDHPFYYTLCCSVFLQLSLRDDPNCLSMHQPFQIGYRFVVHFPSKAELIEEENVSLGWTSRVLDVRIVFSAGNRV